MSFKNSIRNCKKKSSAQLKNFTPTITYYELLELEKEKNESPSVKVTIKRNFPIAPDGYIPNSVVRKFFEIFDENVPEKKVWKLKWKPPELRKEKSQSILIEDQVDENFNFEITSEDEEDEIKSQINTGQNIEYEDPDKVIKELIKNLKNYDWFLKFNSEYTLDNLIRFLVNKLIERDVTNHSDISNLLLEIRSKLKLTRDQVNWIQYQLEEELDATDSEILADNIKLLPNFCTENFKIDNQLLNILASKNIPDDVKANAMESLCYITNLEENDIEFALRYLKRLNNPNYKKLDKFVLRKFINEIQKENQLEFERKNRVYNVEEETDCELFKQLQKEDWISQSIKDELKNLKDYLTYILKSLKTVKSVTFYEKLCNYLKLLFDEFKLVNSNWEIEIVNGLINNNIDTKVNDQLRCIDMENLEKYLATTKNKQIREDILSELLRSATLEKNRPHTLSKARSILEKIVSTSDLDALIDFYASKNFKINWSDALNYYKTRPDITLDEFREIKGSGVILRDIKSAIRSDNSSKKTINSKKKKEKTNKKIGESVEKTEKKKVKKVNKPVQPEIIQEKTEIDLKSNFKSPKKTLKSDNIESQFHLVKNNIEPKEELKTEFRLTKNESKKNNQNYANTDKDELTKNQNENKTNSTKRSVSNLLPNNSRTWDFYQKRNGDLNDLILNKNSTNDSFDKLTKNLDNIQQEVNVEDKIAPYSDFEDHEETDHEEYEYETIKIYSSSDTDNYRENSNFTDHDKNENTLDERKRTKNSREILEGITKRVIIADTQNMKKLSNQEFFRRYNTMEMDSDEKGHFIEPPDLKSNNDNFKFRRMIQNKKTTEYEYNQLLECLIIRGLDLHNHYEKLLPKSLSSKAESFIPIPFFKDFLVVHPYNSKTSSRQMTNLDLRGSHKLSNNPMKSNKESVASNINENLPNFNLKSISNLYPIRKINNRNLRRRYQIGNEYSKITDMELNHLFLINKLLISYDTQNFNQFYSTINRNFKCYFNRLHSRIPPRIVPLIWNDPVMQKLALIISSSKKFKHKIDNVDLERKEPQLHKILYDEPKLDTENQREISYQRRRFYQIRKQVNPLPKQESKKTIFNSWPVFKSEDTPKNKVLKRRLYQQLLTMKHDYMKLQWKYMVNRNSEPKNTKTFLPPLSFKAHLFYPSNSN
ncbi:unnamed protein product [Brachionus calyciflorus]|uniref:Uncharacterized protein n=1 Tax=Brachionus calyciflorus TaxID=104777 RepID=A0A813M7J6_9BILA|nr:unnamed protein product [Brachionus calyciflorus]